MASEQKGPPPEDWMDKAITVGTWVVAILAVAFLLWIFSFIIRWVMGDVDADTIGTWLALSV